MFILFNLISLSSFITIITLVFLFMTQNRRLRSGKDLLKYACLSFIPLYNVYQYINLCLTLK